MGGWETWSLALKEKHGMKVSEKRLLMKILRAEARGETGG
jgi:hypothetical protein